MELAAQGAVLDCRDLLMLESLKLKSLTRKKESCRRFRATVAGDTTAPGSQMGILHSHVLVVCLRFLPLCLLLIAIVVIMIVSNIIPIIIRCVLCCFLIARAGSGLCPASLALMPKAGEPLKAAMLA